MANLAGKPGGCGLFAASSHAFFAACAQAAIDALQAPSQSAYRSQKAEFFPQ